MQRERGFGETQLTILGEGTLAQVAARLAFRTAVDLSSVKISLPDRNVAPRVYEGGALIRLIEQRLGWAATDCFGYLCLSNRPEDRDSTSA